MSSGERLEALLTSTRAARAASIGRHRCLPGLLSLAHPRPGLPFDFVTERRARPRLVEAREAMHRSSSLSVRASALILAGATLASACGEGDETADETYVEHAGAAGAVGGGAGGAGGARADAG